MGDAVAPAPGLLERGTTFDEPGEQDRDVLGIQPGPFPDLGDRRILQEREGDEAVAGTALDLAEDAGPFRGERFEGQIEAFGDVLFFELAAAASEEHLVRAGAKELQRGGVAGGIFEQQRERLGSGLAAHRGEAVADEVAGVALGEWGEAGDPDACGPEEVGDLLLQIRGEVGGEGEEMGATGGDQVVERRQGACVQAGQMVGAFQDHHGPARQTLQKFVKLPEGLGGALGRPVAQVALQADQAGRGVARPERRQEGRGESIAVLGQEPVDADPEGDDLRARLSKTGVHQGSLPGPPWGEKDRPGRGPLSPTVRQTLRFIGTAHEVLVKECRGDRTLGPERFQARHTPR